MHLHRIALLGAVVVVVGASSCGGGNGGSKNQASSTPSTSSSGGAVVKTVTIQETEYKLTPSSVSLAKPGTYIFKGVNKGTVSHAIAVEGQGVDMDSEPVAPGKTTTLKVTLGKAGSYEMYCPVDGHKDQGMKGTITVGSSGAAGTSSPSGTSTSDDTTTTDTGDSSSGGGY